VTLSLARLLSWLLLLGTAAVAGAYTVYYLLEWEWARAQIAGVAFVGALVIGSTVLLLARMRRLERQLEQLAAVTPVAVSPSSVAHTLKRDPVPGRIDLGGEPRPRFDWLLERSQHVWLLPVLAGAGAGTSLLSEHRQVFIPMFLASGLVLGAVASWVEHLAALRHRPVDATNSASRRPRFAVLAALVVVLAGTAGGLYWLSHYWGENLGRGNTTFLIRVQNNGPTSDPRDAVETVGRYCALNTGIGVRYRDATQESTGRVLLRVAPILDEKARDRFRGCLEDAVLEWHRFEVAWAATGSHDVSAGSSIVGPWGHAPELR
jgi:hypothetical protein